MVGNVGVALDIAESTAADMGVLDQVDRMAVSDGVGVVSPLAQAVTRPEVVIAATIKEM